MSSLTAIFASMKPFLIGLVLLSAGTFQQTNSAKNRWLLAIPTNLLISCCLWFNVSYIASKDLKNFVILAVGSALGSAIGIYYGNKH